MSILAKEKQIYILWSKRRIPALGSPSFSASILSYLNKNEVYG